MDDQRTGDGRPSPGSVKGWERRLGEERRKAERRTLEVHVERDRRSGWDRRTGGDRRKR